MGEFFVEKKTSRPLCGAVGESSLEVLDQPLGTGLSREPHAPCQGGGEGGQLRPLRSISGAVEGAPSRGLSFGSHCARHFEKGGGREVRRTGPRGSLSSAPPPNERGRGTRGVWNGVCAGSTASHAHALSPSPLLQVIILSPIFLSHSSAGPKLLGPRSKKSSPPNQGKELSVGLCSTRTGLLQYNNSHDYISTAVVRGHRAFLGRAGGLQGR